MTFTKAINLGRLSGGSRYGLALVGSVLNRLTGAAEQVGAADLRARERARGRG